MKKMIMVITGIMVMAVSQTALASDSGHHMNGENHATDMKGHGHMKSDTGTMKKGAFLVKKEIDGYTVSFHVMKAKEGMQHGGTHNIMAKVEKDDKALTDLMVNSKVTHPNGTSESKMLMKMGDWYMSGYDLGHEGTHQLMALFKTSDGKNHFVGTYYPENKHQSHDEDDAQESE